MEKREIAIDVSMPLENLLVATKFYVPVTMHPLISRPRLNALLQQSQRHPLTLLSAPAGFGKTTLLSTWVQSLPERQPLVAWVSLDEEDNEPQLFWTYVLTALKRQEPERFTSLLEQLQSPDCPPLKYILTALINLLAEGTEHFVLVLDDYQVITEQQVHTTLSYLVEHLPLQMHIILATRTDPPLPFSLLRVRKQVLEVRTEQLRCTAEETGAFFDTVMGTKLPDETIEHVRSRTEGWLVGLQLLGLSLRGGANPMTLLQEAGGSQRYILDYLTEEVLRRQPQEMQTFLLSTCILERLSASLCDAVTEQTSSQEMLEHLEQANVFVVSLDSKRQWYRYHALFAEALHYQLERTRPDVVPILHHRASLWYAQHDQTTQAVLHAFKAHQWQWAADLIERLPLTSLTWGSGEHELIMLRQWLEQLPADIVRFRPRLCLACTQMLWAVAPPSKLQAWFDAAEAMLTASLTMQTSPDGSHLMLASKAQQEQEDLLGQVIAWRAVLRSFEADGQAVLALCQQAQSLLSPQSFVPRALVAFAQLQTYYYSSANDAVAAIQSGLQAGHLAQAAGKTVLTISNKAFAAMYMIGAGQLHEAQQLSQQVMQQGTQPGGLVLPDVGWPALLQAEILREWNQLNVAYSLAQEAIAQCKQTESIASSTYLCYGYAILLRIALSRKDLSTACSALREIERLNLSMNLPTHLLVRSFFTTVDQVRLWLACGELKRAIRWAEDLDLVERHGTPFAHEREEVACIRILLAENQPTLALQRLESVLQRATVGQRWGHVIETRLLQVLAYQMSQEKTQALNVLCEALRLAEPQGYIRSFVEEGLLIGALLTQLRKEQCKYGPTPYLDTVLAAFVQHSQAHEPQSKRAGDFTKPQPLPDPLSKRELEVLQLLAHGVSNQEIGQELVIAIDTVKRHVSQIYAKLGVQNRIQAVTRARTLGLLDEEF